MTMTCPYETMLFIRHQQGDLVWYTVDRFAPEQIGSEEFLLSADPHIMQVGEDGVTITVANGRAHYRITERDGKGLVRLVRIG